MDRIPILRLKTEAEILGFAFLKIAFEIERPQEHETINAILQNSEIYEKLNIWKEDSLHVSKVLGHLPIKQASKYQREVDILTKNLFF